MASWVRKEEGGRGRWKGGEYGEGILVFGHVIE